VALKELGFLLFQSIGNAIQSGLDIVQLLVNELVELAKGISRLSQLVDQIAQPRLYLGAGACQAQATKP
jgi:hypothetical protein